MQTKMRTLSLALLALPAFLAGPTLAQKPQVVMDTSDHSGGWVGKAAAPFTLTSSDGKAVDLSRVLGTKPVVLVFYRGVWCPFCHSQMADLSRHRADFERAGASVYAISDEGGAKLNQMRDAEHLGFVSFLSDPDGAAAKKYAGLYPGSMTHQPGSFVIDKGGRIVYAHVNQDYKSRAATTAMLQAVRKSK